MYHFVKNATQRPDVYFWRVWFYKSLQIFAVVELTILKEFRGHVVRCTAACHGNVCSLLHHCCDSEIPKLQSLTLSGQKKIFGLRIRFISGWIWLQLTLRSRWIISLSWQYFKAPASWQVQLKTRDWAKGFPLRLIIYWRRSPSGQNSMAKWRRPFSVQCSKYLV